MEFLLMALENGVVPWRYQWPADMTPEQLYNVESFLAVEKKPARSTCESPNYGRANLIVAATKADIRYCVWPVAYYCIDGDYIRMPAIGHFPFERDFHETRFHELAHWAQRGGADAKGELVAEIGACFMLARLNLPTSDDLENHTKHLDSWLACMRQDPTWIGGVLLEVNRVADFIFSFSNPLELG